MGSVRSVGELAGTGALELERCSRKIIPFGYPERARTSLAQGRHNKDGDRLALVGATLDKVTYLVLKAKIASGWRINDHGR